ncbi:BSP-domain-containing protein [Aspergillus steynii IBT 23096]|uniref:BSP-domain-containing protein n=1 Tax=Aspergillus steynii IBT 23096 TaxID=1392250 RepID=A0A2I2FSJ1_9EURO|nr:BSP-domain-containing protein [Aspergillus steynii IBT 23096]PLB43584.1 BSP-domain-containing protein [Aspergillus steynii IBT 23096]
MTESSEKQGQLQSIPRATAAPPRDASPAEAKESIRLRADIPTPKLRFHVNDIRHPAFQSFLSLIPDLQSVLDTALSAIIQNLYTVPPLRPSSRITPSPQPNLPRPIFHPSVPPTRSVTLLLRDIGGVAYTTGTELDNDHKEIHLSLSYIHTSTRKADPTAELRGVLTHELVHCYQHTAPAGSTNRHPPGGLIEGIADFVRLKAGLAPPHWKRPTSAQDRPENWDQGYQHTAYFLAWLEDVRVGPGAIGMLNDRLLRVGYYVHKGNEDSDAGGSRETDFWEALFGSRIEDLWHAYGVYLDRLGEGNDGDRDDGAWQDEIVNPE